MLLFLVSVLLDIVYYTADKGSHRAMSYVGAVLACLILLSFLLLLRRWQPYRFVIQQSLETALVIVTVLVLLLAMLYNALIPSSGLSGCVSDPSTVPSSEYAPPAPPQPPGCGDDFSASERYAAERKARGGVLVAIEMLMVLLILLSLVFAFGYAVYDFVRTERHVLNAREKNARNALVAEEIDKDVIDLLQKGDLRLVSAEWLMQSENHAKLPRVTEAVATLRAHGVHMRTITGWQKAQLVDEIALIARVDPICITLCIKHEDGSHKELTRAIEQFNALAPVLDARADMDFELRLPETKEVAFQRDCRSFVRLSGETPVETMSSRMGAARQKDAQGMEGVRNRVTHAPVLTPPPLLASRNAVVRDDQEEAYEEMAVDADPVSPVPSPPPSPPPNPSRRGSWSARVQPEGGAVNGTVAPSWLRRVQEGLHQAWRWISRQSAADAAEARRQEKLLEMIGRLQRELHAPPAVDIATGPQLRSMVEKLEKLEGQAQTLGVQADHPDLAALRRKLDLASRHLVGLQELVMNTIVRLSPTDDLETKVSELQQSIIAAEGYGEREDKLKPHRLKMLAAQRAQAECKDEMNQTRENLLTILQETNSARVDIVRLKVQIQLASKLAEKLETRAHSKELEQLGRGLRELVTTRALPALAGAQKAASDVKEVRRRLERERTTIVCKSESGCRVDLMLLRGAIEQANETSTLLNDATLLADDIKRAEETYTEERERCRKFMEKLDALDEAQKAVQCEFTLTLCLSAFLQAEITQDDLQRKLDDVTSNLEDALGKHQTRTELLTKSLGASAAGTVSSAAASATVTFIYGELIGVKKMHGRTLLPRCQYMPEEALAPRATAVERYRRQKRDVHVLSYGWRTPGQASDRH